MVTVRDSKATWFQLTFCVYVRRADFVENAFDLVARDRSTSIDVERKKRLRTLLVIKFNFCGKLNRLSYGVIFAFY